MVYREHPAFRKSDWAVMAFVGLALATVMPKLLPFDCTFAPVITFVATSLLGAALTFAVIALIRGFGFAASGAGLVVAFVAGGFAMLSHLCP